MLKNLLKHLHNAFKNSGSNIAFLQKFSNYYKGSKYLFGVLLFVGLVILTTKVNAQVIQSDTLNGPTPIEVVGDPFIQPNINIQIGRKSLDWYGSGDANNDERIDSSDVEAITDGVTNDRADVNGDAVINQTDCQLILEYLSCKIPYLPGHWNTLKTREEKKNWTMKMRKLVDPISIVTGPGPVCADYIHQLIIEFYGISNITTMFQTYSYRAVLSNENNARFNIPLYYFSVTSINSIPHAISGILVGENPLNFNDWLFLNYYNNDTVYPGDFNMDPNHPVMMYQTAFRIDTIIDGTLYKHFNVGPFLTFFLENGVASPAEYGGISSLGYGKYAPLTIHNPFRAQLNVGKLENIVIDAAQLKDKSPTPKLLEELGFNAIPDTSTNNVYWPTFLNYSDSKQAWSSDSSGYQFNRRWYFGFTGGGVTLVDSSLNQTIEVDNITRVREFKTEPNEFKVFQNYPNPFNPTTTIRYAILQQSFVNISIYNLLGEKILTLINEEKHPGNYEVLFDGSNLSSGVYFYKIVSSNFIETKKLILMK